VAGSPPFYGEKKDSKVITFPLFLIEILIYMP
jgi:hypothetical protein